MDSASGSTDPTMKNTFAATATTIATNVTANRPTRPLPSNAPLSSIERDPNLPVVSPDLGGTLVSHTPDGLAELSSDSDDDDGAGTGSKRRKGKSKYNVPRRQIKIEYIQDKSRRNITFGKRKNGIFKKAQEISTLTGCEVMLIVAPKDSELQAYTYATSRLQPLVSDPAGEAYIQNCLRYGALMPGTSSSITAPYGVNGSNNQGSHVSTLRTAPRVSPAPNPTTISYNSLYSYVNNNSVPRRAQLSYGMSHPLSLSPQSSPATNITTQTPQSTSISDQSKREPSDSPVQHLGLPHRNPTSKPQQLQPQQWSPGPSVPSTEFSSSPAVSGLNSSIGSSSREIPGDWVVAHPRTLFQTSSPLGPTSMTGRGLSAIPVSTSTSGNVNGYHHLGQESNSFQRPPSDCSMIAQSPWSTLSQSSPGIRASSLQPAQSIGNTNTASASHNNNSSNEAGFLEPLVLSQPYDSRNFGAGDDTLSAATNYPNRVPSVNMQSSVSSYGEPESFDRVTRSTAYLHEDHSETDNKPYVLETTDQSWTSGIH